MDKAIQVLVLTTIILAATLCLDLTKADSLQRPSSRSKRQAIEVEKTEHEGLSGEPGEAEQEGSGEPEVAKKGGGVSLGKILGLVFLACCIIYCIGISWKVYNVCKGTYVEEEPVFLKYK